MSEKTYTIMVLNDGETYSDLGGCAIASINEEGHEKLCEGVKFSNLDDDHLIFYTTFTGLPK